MRTRPVKLSLSHPPNLIVGLTGTIGSGKSAVADLLAQHGAAIIDADVLARQAVEPGTPGLEAITEKFGREFLLADGTLNRRKLGQHVFSDPRARQQLEDMLHPHIYTLWQTKLAALLSSETPRIIFYVVPLLFESKISHPELDATVVATAPDSLCLERIARRDGLSTTDALARMKSQLPSAEKAKRADFVIDNGGDMGELTAQVGELMRLLEEAREQAAGHE